MEDELSAGGGGVDLLSEALKADLAVIELRDVGDEVFERPTQPVQLPDNEGIIRPDVGKRFCQAFPFSLCA